MHFPSKKNKKYTARDDKRSYFMTTKEIAKCMFMNNNEKSDFLNVIFGNKAKESEKTSITKTILLADDNNVYISSHSTISSLSDSDQYSNRPCTISKPKLKSCLKKLRKSAQDHARKIIHLPKSSYQVQLPAQVEYTTRSRCISFHEYVAVRTIPTVSELVDGDIKNLYYQKDEYDKFKLNIIALIHYIEDGKVSKNDYCTRGLESLLKKNHRESRALGERSFVIHSVLDKQNEQFQLGIFDEKQLSHVYRVLNWNSTINAAKQGAIDEATSRRIVRNKQVKKVV
jgi:hypothetical protein